jgi:hypothetical protein
MSYMGKILESASKIVFILLASVACIAYLWGIFTGKVILDTKDFMVLAGMAFGFYFANKGEANQPYLGK